MNDEYISVFPAHAGVILLHTYLIVACLVFPAHAGVILNKQRKIKHYVSVPRTRGGDPDREASRGVR